jgi:hypothetical protein
MSLLLTFPKIDQLLGLAMQRLLHPTEELGLLLALHQ